MKIYPINVDYLVPVTDGKGRMGNATFEMINGKYPTQELIAEATAGAKSELAQGIEVMENADVQIVTKLLITDGEPGGREGAVEITQKPGQIMPEEEFAEILKNIGQNIPEGMRLMTRHEAFQYNVQERTGVSEVFALPRLKDGEEWHDPETAEISIYQTQPWRADEPDFGDDDYGYD